VQEAHWINERQLAPIIHQWSFPFFGWRAGGTRATRIYCLEPTTDIL
jgi:hypothetical protein